MDLRKNIVEISEKSTVNTGPKFINITPVTFTGKEFVEVKSGVTENPDVTKKTKLGKRR